MTNTTNAEGAFCQHCGKFLAPRKQEILGKEVVLGYVDCECEGAKRDREREAAEEAERLAREEREKEERLYRRAGIPKHFWPNIVTVNPVAIQRVIGGGSLYLEGDVGSGKTTYACQIVKELLKGGERSVCFLPAADLSPMVRSSFRKDAKETENDIVHRYATCRVLMLDDLGKDGTTDHAVGTLERIIDGRYREELPVIVTSQYSRAALVDHLAKNGNIASAKAIVSRLKEMCSRIRFEDIDHRLNNNQLPLGGAER